MDERGWGEETGGRGFRPGAGCFGPRGSASTRGGVLRPDAECGNGVRGPELDPRRSAEVECGIRNSTRDGVRKWNAGSGTRPEAGRGKGMRDPQLHPRRGAEKECGTRNSRRGGGRKGMRRRGQAMSESVTPPRIENPHREFLFRTPPCVESQSRIPLPHPASGRVTTHAFHFRTPPRVEFLIPHSTSAPRLGSSSESRIPLPHSASG